MTKQQAEQVRKLVDDAGWKAVRKHPELWHVIQRDRKDSKKYVDQVVDR